MRREASRIWPGGQRHFGVWAWVSSIVFILQARDANPQNRHLYFVKMGRRAELDALP